MINALASGDRIPHGRVVAITPNCGRSELACKTAFWGSGAKSLNEANYPLPGATSDGISDRQLRDLHYVGTRTALTLGEPIRQVECGERSPRRRGQRLAFFVHVNADQLEGDGAGVVGIVPGTARDHETIAGFDL